MCQISKTYCCDYLQEQRHLSNPDRECSNSSLADFVHPSTSTTDKHPRCLDSSGHLSTTDTEREESNIDAITSLSMDLDKVPSFTSILRNSIDEALDSVSTNSASTTTCLFCSHKQKKCGKQVLNLIFPRSENVQKIKTMAETLNDLEILSKLENQTVAYHNTCFASYRVQEKRYTEEHLDTIVGIKTDSYIN
ncbi:uncharacterized protein LOC143900902 [Temnothorax americanus]|uniref:uncharacterized protein LOC143900902 n=1 Tax=Temnothorax americanus TaxID=1964332 RepID=UPI004068E3CA